MRIRSANVGAWESQLVTPLRRPEFQLPPSKGDVGETTGRVPDSDKDDSRAIYQISSAFGRNFMYQRPRTEPGVLFGNW